MTRLLPYPLILFSFLFTARTAGAAPIKDVVLPAEERVVLVPRMEMLEDPSHGLKPDRVLGDAGHAFRPLSMRRPSFGQSDSTFWFRFTVRNGAPRQRRFYVQIEFPRLDEIDYFELPADEKEPLIRYATGDSRPFAQRPVLHPNFVFPLNLGPGESRRIFLRVRTKGVTQVPLVIRDEKSFRARSEARKLLLGGYYGVLFVMAVYNLALLGALRDRVYAYYSLSILSFALYQMTSNGIAYEYLWSESPVWNDRALPFFTSMACVGTIVFSTRFLDTRRFTRRLHPLYTILLLGAWLSAGLSLSPYYIAGSHLIRLLALIFIVSIIYSSIVGLRRGYRPALFYLIAWSGYLAGIVLFVMQLRGWVESNPVTESAMQIGSALEVFLLSLGLADRIQTIRRQKERARAKALKNRRLAMRRLREANQLKDEFLARLDLQVRERTRELNTTLEELRERDEIIRFQLDMARGIQSAILPAEMKPDLNHHWAVHYEALEEVGGDFYDVLPLPGGGFALIVADASGHGVPAALMTMIAKIAFAEALRMGGGPHDILRYMRRSFLDTLDNSEHYVTAALVLVGTDGTLEFSNAGHVAPFILRGASGRAEVPDVPGIFLGGIDFDADPYRTRRMRFEPGDRIFLFTDGVTEAMNADREMYGEERLREIARARRHESIENIRDAILTDWREHVGDEPRTDDMTLVILEAVSRSKD